jgi:flagellar biosynthesis protein FliQ
VRGWGRRSPSSSSPRRQHPRLSYTGVALGAEIAIARIVLALSFGIGIGMIMAMIFRKSEAARQGDARAFAGDGRVPAHTLLFLGTLVALLIAGTLKVDLLTATLWQHTHGLARGGKRAGLLDRWVPANEATGAEGISLQGVALIALLGLPSALLPGAASAWSTTA